MISYLTVQGKKQIFLKLCLYLHLHSYERPRDISILYPVTNSILSVPPCIQCDAIRWEKCLRNCRLGRRQNFRQNI